MDKDELNHLLSDCEYFLNDKSEVNLHNFVENLRTTYFESREKRIEELEKACDETQELLDKQIEATLKLDKENAELKEQISTNDILIKELQEQKAYWKESSFDWRHKFFKLDKVKRLIKKDKQLTKSTELIKKLYAVYYDPCVTESDLKYRDELFAEIKQFISEVEK